MVFLLAVLSSFAQKKVIVQGTFPNIYVKHKVVAGETYYSISKLYNLATAQVAQQSNSVLAVGTILSVPLDKNNFTQDGQSGEEEFLVPIHHIVQKGETLFRISQEFGKVRIDFLREWNDLNNDYIQPGQKIVIGHLKVDKKKAGEVLERTFYDGKDDVSSTGNTAVISKVENPNNNTNSTTNNEESEGYFVTQYSPGNDNNTSIIVRSGDASMFKSTSGWTDKKYYVLMNNITPGTIVRITVAKTGKSICAKVLGGLPEMKENSNLMLRLSNAAVAVLKQNDKKFEVKVSYYNN